MLEFDVSPGRPRSEVEISRDGKLYAIDNEGVLPQLPAAQILFEVRVGDSREVILDAAATWKADLIVMGARGRRGLSRLILGSVSQTVLLYSPCSTLIARAEDNARMKTITNFNSTLNRCG
ncbi:MAG TPA: universal stress protein [Oculatellaceae cyanobacterium]